MLASGATVRAFDPAAMPNARAIVSDLETVDSAAAVFVGADAVVIATEWPEFAELPYAELVDRMTMPLVVDGRRLLDAPRLRELGYRVATVGTSGPDG